MTVRFQLGEMGLGIATFENSQFSKRMGIYKGPKELESILCKNCDSEILQKVGDSKGFKIKQAPSQNFGDILDLWQCHNENYDRLIDPATS